MEAGIAAMEAALADLNEAERTDQLEVPYPGLPPSGGDATEVELMQLQPRGEAEPVRSPMRDTIPDPGPASKRHSSSLDTFEMPALGPPGPAAASDAATPGPAPSAEAEQASRDYRSVSGEVEVRAAASGQTEPDPDEADSFTAVSVLLGSSKDAVD
jgi:hypothetical protein